MFYLYHLLLPLLLLPFLPLLISTALLFLLSQTFLCFFILGFIFSLQASLQALLFAPFPVLHGSSYIFSTPRSLNYWQLLSTDLHREPRISIFYRPFLQFTWTGELFYLMSVLLNVLSLTLTIFLLNVFSLMSFLSPHFFYLMSFSLTSLLLSLFLNSVLIRPASPPILWCESSHTVVQ